MLNDYQKRQNKTELSIKVSWAINNASNFVPEAQKGTPEGFELIKAYYPRFLELYHEFMLEHLPAEDWTKDMPKEVVEEQIATEQASFNNLREIE